MSVDRSLSEHIAQALMDLESADVPLMGKRKIALFLQGKVNANSLELGLHRIPAWGSLPFIPIRKLQSILEGMVDAGILEILESPKKGFPVLRTSRGTPTGQFSLKRIFPLETGLDLNRPELDLFRELRNERTRIAKDTGVFFTRLVPDKVLVRIAKKKPRNIESLRNIVGTKGMRSEYWQFIAIIDESFPRQGSFETAADDSGNTEKLEGALKELNELMKQINSEYGEE